MSERCAAAAGLPDLPARPADGHKGTFGTVLVVGGSVGMIGAPALVARAAFRMGVGLVKVATAGEVLHQVIGLEPSATGVVLPGDPSEALAAIGRADPEKSAVLAIGPGLGVTAETIALVEGCLADPSRAVVLDADGLNALAVRLASGCLVPGTLPGRLVVTPHPGEFARLAHPLGIRLSGTDPAEREGAARALAEALGATVVLKGQGTVVAASCDRLYVNESGHSAMGTGGSGDVLTGVIASLIAQGLDPFNAARLGVYLHGRAAESWVARYADRGMLARELTDALTEAVAGYVSS
ncbi:NAD(P)H-hydrate dehydratase [Mucisphaera sp.]|uniref:NAD(P)H-hydrate dehydratase n=1 Tax=Mucisphaera sp. TaxID=2913024 RepID=UPI003D13E437